MKLPRDLSGLDLAKALSGVGYRVTRQTGSHLRLTNDGPPQHHVTIPAHDPLKLGTLSAVLAEVASNLKTTREELATRLFS
ncbi:MAG TPA: type II toxin-antitoxin system HicA family toxin [Thermoanaerobaculia bacterium]|nr:type II toxin-antitoxin system HicA family toxin [Thermoanaerobaculia bacterium]